MARRYSKGWGGYRPYVKVARRRQMAANAVKRARKRGEALEPVVITGRKIATTPWGSAWCDHIESFHDYENRLPRGRTYVRNGSVYHLEIRPGEIRGLVMGSIQYEQRIVIAPCKPAVWKRVKKRCAGGIGSLIELLEGRLSSKVMAEMTAEDGGLMPDLKHVDMDCSCPDWAGLCKHLAAVLYGVGARLDERPELLFTLRGVDPAELVDGAALPGQKTRPGSEARKLEGDLASVFGIELEEEVEVVAPAKPARKKAQKKTAKKTAKKAMPAAKRRTRKILRRELLGAGVPAGTIGTWLRQGILEACEERGVYRHTAESRSRLKRYGA